MNATLAFAVIEKVKTQKAEIVARKEANEKMYLAYQARRNADLAELHKKEQEAKAIIFAEIGPAPVVAPVPVPHKETPAEFRARMEKNIYFNWGRINEGCLTTEIVHWLIKGILAPDKQGHVTLAQARNIIYSIGPVRFRSHTSCGVRLAFIKATQVCGLTYAGAHAYAY